MIKGAEKMSSGIAANRAGTGPISSKRKLGKCRLKRQ